MAPIGVVLGDHRREGVVVLAGDVDVRLDEFVGGPVTETERPMVDRLEVVAHARLDCIAGAPADRSPES